MPKSQETSKNLRETICVFGDSTAWGAWDLEKGGWVTRLWSYVGVREDDYVEIYIFSVSGGTTETILERFEAEAKIRYMNQNGGLIFQTGGNDSAGVGSPQNYNVSPDKFEANIQKIIDKARRLTAHIIFVGFKECDESKTMPVPWINHFYTNASIKKYNDIMEAVCKKNDIPFLNISGLLVDTDFVDGLHPNESGHQKIFVKVRDFLEGEGWI